MRINEKNNHRKADVLKNKDSSFNEEEVKNFLFSINMNKKDSAYCVECPALIDSVMSLSKKLFSRKYNFLYPFYCQHV
jgi:hypothetical protein